MYLNNRLDLVQSQKLVMTTQLKQSLEILNMSSLELVLKVMIWTMICPLKIWLRMRVTYMNMLNYSWDV